VGFFQKHAWQILSQVMAVVVAVVGFSWVAVAQVERLNQSMSSVTERIGKVERTLENMHTLDLRVTRLEEGMIKVGDIVSRLERAVVRLEALAEK
jgi:hypothetical protein